MKKAQSSVEFIVILAVVLVIFGILFTIIQENYSAYERTLKTVHLTCVSVFFLELCTPS